MLILIIILQVPLLWLVWNLLLLGLYMLLIVVKCSWVCHLVGVLRSVNALDFFIGHDSLVRLSLLGVRGEVLVARMGRQGDSDELLTGTLMEERRGSARCSITTWSLSVMPLRLGGRRVHCGSGSSSRRGSEKTSWVYLGRPRLIIHTSMIIAYVVVLIIAVIRVVG